MKKETIKSFGQRIKFLRKHKNLTQACLANLINKSEDTISNIERGICSTKMGTVERIAEALNVNIADLFDFPIIEWNGCDIEKKSLIKKILDVCYEQDEKTLTVILDNIEKLNELIKNRKD